MNNGLVWLSSYPKSGNTWFRIVLANLLNQTSDSINLNQLNIGVNMAARSLINQLLGFNSTLFDHDELSKLRPLLYQWYGHPENNFHRYLKIHDAYSIKDYPLIPHENCSAIIYFIRNPLDVAISFAHHLNFSIDQTIEIMGQKDFTFFEGNKRATPQLRQYFSSWSMHVKSWTLDCELDVLLLRYEDMSFTALETFSEAFKFLKLDFSEEKIAKAIENGHFEKLQRQEKKDGFSERSAAQPGLFFRKGKVGDWENTLTETQINRIISDHGDIMQTYGYLDHNFYPVCAKDFTPLRTVYPMEKN